jgi:iron complex outermembrane recepter protein
MSQEKPMNLVRSHQKILTARAFLPLCFVINILAIAISIPANARSFIENNSVREASLKENRVQSSSPATRKLLTQAAAVKITGIKVSTTAKGIEIRLESPTANIPQPASQNANVTVTYDIPNATLALPNATEYRAVNPDRGIAEISVVQVTPTSVRVSITGKEALPEITVATGTDSLVFNAVPTIASTAGEEIDINVIGRRKGGYNVPNTSTATGTNTPILETPVSVQVVPQELIRDRQTTQVKEALTNVSGVTYNGDLNNRSGNTFSIRGFSGGTVLQDGFRRFGSAGENGTQPITEINNVEQIEVLKGPASILYGAIEPGGLINIVSKQPLANPFYEVEVQGGSRNLFRPRFDVSGPLTADGKVLYRVNGLYQNLNSFTILTQPDQKVSIAPTVAWKINDKTDLSVSVEYVAANRPADFGVFAIGTGVANVPRDRISNEPSDSITNRSIGIGYKLNHQFNSSWKLSNAFRYSSSEFDFGVIALPIAFDETTNTVDRIFASQDAQNRDYTFQTNLTGEFATGDVKHTLLTGVDYVNRNSRFFITADFTPRPLDLFNPTYGIAKPNESSLEAFGGSATTGNSFGFYVQDQIAISKNFKVLAGVRYDTLSQTTINLVNPGESSLTASALTPRLGLLYQLNDKLSLYGSYSQSFTPNTATTSSGAVLDPQRGKGYEFGVKSELLDGKLLATLAYFDISKQNVPVTDPAFPLSSIAIGEQRSRGIELDVAGEISPGWKIIAAYAYTNADIAADSNPLNIGKKLFGVPEHAASLWTTYQIGQGDLKGLGFGAGLTFKGDRQGNLANTYRIGSYVTADAGIFYKRDDWRFALNFKNIGDLKYIESTAGGGEGGNTGGNIFGDPFTIQATASFQF